MKEQGELEQADIEIVKSAISKLEPIAKKSSCSVSELVEKYAMSDEPAEEGDDDKVNMIVAKLKAKNDYEA